MWLSLCSVVRGIYRLSFSWSFSMFGSEHGFDFRLRLFRLRPEVDSSGGKSVAANSLQSELSGISPMPPGPAVSFRPLIDDLPGFKFIHKRPSGSSYRMNGRNQRLDSKVSRKFALCCWIFGKNVAACGGGVGIGFHIGATLPNFPTGCKRNVSRRRLLKQKPRPARARRGSVNNSNQALPVCSIGRSGGCSVGDGPATSSFLPMTSPPAFR